MKTAYTLYESSLTNSLLYINNLYISAYITLSTQMHHNSSNQQRIGKIQGKRYHKEFSSLLTMVNDLEK